MSQASAVVQSTDPATADLPPDPSRPPPMPRFGSQIRTADLVGKILATLDAEETVNAFCRGAIRREIARRSALVAQEMADLDRLDWSRLICGQVSL